MPARHPLHPTSPSVCAGLIAAAVLAACGGGGDGGGGSQPVATTTLAISATSLALAVSGQARVLTVTNTGTNPAQAIQVTSGVALPIGTVSTSNCSNLAVATSCTITITPGATPSAAPGTSPVPVSLNVSGSNTNTLTAEIQVLGHGTLYQGGYVFSIDDTTPTSGSVGGKVVSVTNLSAAIRWSTTFFDVPGALSLVDGEANTQAIVAAQPTEPVGTYAAGLCSGTVSNGYADWYLPAVCETGYDANGATTGCGTQAAPLTDNWQSNLVDKGDIGSLSSGQLWTSTQFSGSLTQAWTKFPTGGPSALTASKQTFLPMRCVRRLTL